MKRSDLIEACPKQGWLDRFEIEILMALLCGMLLGTMLGMAIIA